MKSGVIRGKPFPIFFLIQDGKTSEFTMTWPGGRELYLHIIQLLLVSHGKNKPCAHMDTIVIDTKKVTTQTPFYLWISRCFLKAGGPLSGAAFKKYLGSHRNAIGGLSSYFVFYSTQ